MGLDINFFKAKRAAWNKFQEEQRKYDKLTDEEASNTEYPKMEDEEVGYFRKVNFLMSELNYTGNCEYKEIIRYDLEQLKVKCEKVLADHDKAEELLPTCSGFFFGNTEYNEWYFQDVQEVFDWVSGVLDGLKNDDVVLMYFWW